MSLAETVDVAGDRSGAGQPGWRCVKNYAVFRTPVRKNLKMHQVEKAQSRCQMLCI